MRIRWVDRVTKKDVFWRTGEKRSLWKNFVKRRDKLIGHLSQHVGILKNNNWRKNRGMELQWKALTCVHRTNYEGCRLHNVHGNEKKGWKKKRTERCCKPILGLMMKRKIRKDLIHIYAFLAHFPKMEIGLWDHHPICVSVCPLSINFWTNWYIFIKFGRHVMPFKGTLMQ
jgi:hypothetical protein